MCEDITLTDSCQHDGVRIFVGILVLGFSSSQLQYMKVCIVIVGDAKVITELYRDVFFPCSFVVQKVKEVVDEFQCIQCIYTEVMCNECQKKHVYSDMGKFLNMLLYKFVYLSLLLTMNVKQDT